MARILEEEGVSGSGCLCSCLTCNRFGLGGSSGNFIRIDVALNDQRQIDDQNRQKNDTQNRTDNGQNLLLIVCCLVRVCLAHKEAPLVVIPWVYTEKRYKGFFN